MDDEEASGASGQGVDLLGTKTVLSEVCRAGSR
jgi:hypothetical protein